MIKNFFLVNPVVYLFIVFYFISTGSNGQTNSTLKLDVTKDSSIIAWIKELEEPGVKLIADSLFISKESQRVLADAQYRAIVYPKVYTWEATKGFIQNQDLKKALWFFINLYIVNDQNKEMVVKSILVYDKIFKMDKLLVSAFYTYCLTDPEIGTIEDGHSEITAPHIMEKKLNALKEMLFYLDKYKPEGRKDSATD